MLILIFINYILISAAWRALNNRCTLQAGLILVTWLLMYLGTSKPIILYNYCHLRIMVDTFLYIHQHQERFNNIKGYDVPRRCILLAVVDQSGAKWMAP